MVAITLAVELLLMNCIGIFIRKSGAVNGDFVNQLTGMIMKFCIPCLIFCSVSGAGAFSLEALINCGVVIALSAGTVLLSLLIGQVLYLACGKSGAGRVMRYGMAFSNFSFMGIPVMAALFGDMGTFYYAFFLIPVRICYYALSESLMTPPGTGSKRSVGAIVKSTALNPSMIALVLGLVFWVGGWQLPTAIAYCVKSLNNICSPLALLLCGMVIAGYEFKRILKLKYLLLPLLRTLAMPALFFLISRVLLAAGVEKLLCQIMVVYAAFPVAALLPVYAVKYDPDPDNQLNAAAAGVISVLLSAVTVPLWSLLL